MRALQQNRAQSRLLYLLNKKVKNAKMYVSLAIQENKSQAKLMSALASAIIVVITFKMLSVEIITLCYYYKFVHTFSRALFKLSSRCNKTNML